MTENALLAAIAEDPRELTPQHALVDFYAEQDDPRAEAWRWIAAFKRRPWGPYQTPRTKATYSELWAGWGNWTYKGLDWPWSAGLSMLPPEVYKCLPTVERVRDEWYERAVYQTRRRAYEALAGAFVQATRPRTSRLDRFWNDPQWLPDYDLVSQVPNE